MGLRRRGFGYSCWLCMLCSNTLVISFPGFFAGTSWAGAGFEAGAVVG